MIRNDMFKNLVRNCVKEYPGMRLDMGSVIEELENPGSQETRRNQTMTQHSRTAWH